MAHGVKVKAAAVADIIAGVPWDDVQAKYKVSRGTLSTWLKDAKTELGTELSRDRGLPERRESSREAFIGALNVLMGKSIKMLGVWADKACEKEFLDKKPQDALALGTVVLDRVDSIVDKIGLGER